LNRFAGPKQKKKADFSEKMIFSFCNFPAEDIYFREIIYKTNQKGLPK